MTSIDLNADLGENAGHDAALLRIVTSASISCGVHAGDPLTLHRTLIAAEDAGVIAGAHPSYPDRENFGRVTMSLSPHELQATLGYQLAAFASMVGGNIAFIKPHGALYNDAQDDPKIAQAIVNEATFHRCAVLGMPNSQMQDSCDRAGVQFIAEGFADRAYLSTGELAPRTMPGAVLSDPDEIAARVVRMVRDSIVTTIEGTELPIEPDTICLHGDSPDALRIAQAVAAALGAAQIPVRSSL